jgi:FixJ family two-component response regulator
MLATARAQGSAASRKLTKHQARETLKRVAAGETLREIALSFDVDHSTRLKARHAAETL